MIYTGAKSILCFNGKGHMLPIEIEIATLRPVARGDRREKIPCLRWKNSVLALAPGCNAIHRNFSVVSLHGSRSL